MTTNDPQATNNTWLWRVFNLGWPDGHECGTGTWGVWVEITHADAVRLAQDDAEARYQFVRLLPATPAS